MLKNFECTKCGNCCKKVSFEDEEGEKVIVNNGPCKYLDKNNLCTIYESKPEVCNDFPSTLIHIIVCECQGKIKNIRLLKK